MAPSASPSPKNTPGWVTRLNNKQPFSQVHQELKFSIHRKLLDRFNLQAMSALGGERMRTEVRSAVARLIDEERSALSLVEKDRILEEVLDEVFGLGPL